MLQLMAACLCNEGYDRAKGCIDSEGIKILHGAYEVYCAVGEIVIRDWKVPTVQHPGRPLRETLVCIPSGFENTVNSLISRRATQLSAVVIAVPSYQ
jgi:hypothetical protein